MADPQNPPPPPDGSGIVAVSGNPPPPPDGSAVIAAGNASQGQAAAQPVTPAMPAVDLKNPSTVPNARIRNQPNPSDPNAGWWNLYEGAKIGALGASLPASMGAPIAPVVRGLAGGIVGSYGAQKVAQAAGAGPRGQEVAGDVGGVVGGGVASLGKELLPSTERAGAALQDIKATAGDVPINTSKVGDSALELYTQSQRGSTLPPAVNKLVRRLTAPDSAPMTYAEAKDFQSNISNLSANEKMNLKPNQVRLLGQLNADLKASLADAADTVGKGQQFANAMKEYHNAMTIRGYTENAISAGWKTALGALGVRELAKIFDVGSR